MDTTKVREEKVELSGYFFLFLRVFLTGLVLFSLIVVVIRQTFKVDDKNNSHCRSSKEIQARQKMAKTTA